MLMRTAQVAACRGMAARALTARVASEAIVGRCHFTSVQQHKLYTAASSQKVSFGEIGQQRHQKQVRNKSAAVEHELPEREAYNVSKTLTGPLACKEAGIDTLGITGPTTIYKNLTFQELYDHEIANGEGEVAHCEYGDTFTVDTGRFTGRSPKDKWLVKNIGSESDQHIDWGDVNQPTTPEVFKELYEMAVTNFNEKEKAYVFDCFCGASPDSRKKVRFVHEMAWQQHFVTNMFIRPENEQELEGFDPDFTVINACSLSHEEFKKHNLRSEVAVVFNIEERKAVIFGTWYGGENKKGIFSLMNYWLPLAGDLPMHCSANVGKDGDSALFFGLSGTGKTTLSADPHRALIGDDEHGWDKDGVFNFEGGCYAKTIDLTEKKEPSIYRAIHRDALLENVALQPQGDSLVPDYHDVSKTENGRVSYPVFHIDGYCKEQMAGHPNNILFLTCDAFGVLPPVSKLSPEQAMYHFLSGYTAKVAGTELGIKEPVASFSACFGAAFLTHHPTVYADLLSKKMEQHGSDCYLVNTGWTGGAYGVGERMSLEATRACVDGILDGNIKNAEFETDDIFGFEVPKSLPGVDSNILNPRNAWSNKEEYDAMKKKLANMYIKNFKEYEGRGSTDYTKFGPQL
jgi:phosphoenolpyruvate carboxykinase (ATP)